MKKLLVIGLILLAAGLSAQSFVVYVRFIDTTTGLDYVDISNIHFEAELVPGSGDVLIDGIPGTGVWLQDIGAGFPNSFVEFNMGNFINPYDPASIVRVTIWDDTNMLGAGEVLYEFGTDIQPANGSMGWGPFFGGIGGDPLLVEPDGGGPLPVTLSNFSAAEFANQFVEISWTTETESGNQGFNIYRGTTNDLATSTQLNYDLIPGAGSSTEPIVYNFMDEGVVNNTTYWYWLESVSNDETYIHNPVTLNVEFEEDPTPEIPEATELIGNHPNPFNPDTYIVFNVKADETAKLSIYNTKGQVVMNRTFETGFHRYNWQADSNPSGVYFYKLQSESLSSVKKMLLLK